MAKPFQDCVLLIGDSLTSRQEVDRSLHARFSSVYRRQLDVINRGLGAYNTRLSLPLLPHILAKKGDSARTPSIRLVTIWFGANDGASPQSPIGQNVPIPEYTANLHKYLEALTSPDSPYAVAHDSTPLSIILITPPAMVDSMWGMGDRNNEGMEEYAKALRGVGEAWKGKQVQGAKWKVGVADLWSAMMTGGQTGGRERYFNDGLHMTTEGYDVLWAEIERLVHGELKGRGLDWDDEGDLPWRVPDYSKVDPKDPASVLKQLIPREY